MLKSKYPQKSEYSKLLLDPRWQKKRLEVLQRDEFCCKFCMNDEATLHVHHRYYLYQKSPWEYDNDALVTLCENCHEDQSNLKEAEIRLKKALAAHGFLTDHINMIAAAIESIPKKDYINEPLATDISEAIRSIGIIYAKS